MTSALENRKVFALVVFLFALAALVQFLYGDLRAVSSGMTLNTSLVADGMVRAVSATVSERGSVKSSKVDMVCHGSTLPIMPWEVEQKESTGSNQMAAVKPEVDLVAHGSTFPPMPWERNTVAHGSTFPPMPWERNTAL